MPVTPEGRKPRHVLGLPEPHSKSPPEANKQSNPTKASGVLFSTVTVLSFFWFWFCFAFVKASP